MGVLGGPVLCFTLDGEREWSPDPDWFEPLDTLSQGTWCPSYWNTTLRAVDTEVGGLEGGLETGGGVAWGEWPLMTLPFPLVLLLRSSLARAPEKDGLGLEVEGVEEGGLMKGPVLLTIDC